MQGSSPSGSAMLVSKNEDNIHARLADLKAVATVNGSNSAGNSEAIEVPQGESVPIGCSAASFSWCISSAG